MNSENTTAPQQRSSWQSTATYTAGIICLLLGIAIGYLVRGSATPVVPTAAQKSAAVPASQSAAPTAAAEQKVTPEQLRHMADAQAAPLMERLKKEPNNAKLLADIANSYMNAQQFPVAAEYYQKSLKVDPKNTDVRANYGSALWFVGDVDGAIQQFQTALKAEPTKPNALMNLGIVEWQGKMDVKAAVAAWEKLLKTNPNFAGKDNVERLIAQAKKHSNMQTSAKAPHS
jgi:cytochrome c-type biogenesis protein CcmH/NrfG